jgi:ABC-type branched-subunit amino acid transport system substrate-binding protein
MKDVAGCVAAQIMVALLWCGLLSGFPGSAHAAGGSASDIVLGMSAPFSGSSRGLGIELYRGARAYFDYVNSRGGVQGRKVRILALDDGYNPRPALQNTIRFMDDKSVLCLFGYVGTPTVTRVLPLLKAAERDGKLLFFPFTGAQPQREAPYDRFVFNLRASYRQELSALVNKFSLIGLRRIAIFYQNDAYGRSGWDGLRRGLAAHRLGIVSEATYRRGAVASESMREQVQIVMEGHPDAIVVVGSYMASAAFIRDARSMGVHVPIANISFSASENLLRTLKRLGKECGRDLTGDLINTQVVPYYRDEHFESVRLYRSLMAGGVPLPEVAEEGYVSPGLSDVSLEGFLDAVVMTEILRRFLDDPQRSLIHAVEGLHDYDAGIDATVTFGQTRHQGLSRVYFTTVRQGRFVSLEGEGWRQWQK